MNILDKELRKFCVAPMMGYTTQHARNLYRILSKKAYLFSEMITCKTLIHSKKTDYFLENKNQNPVALQVGGCDIEDLIKCCKLAAKHKFNEINLNLGCPSKAVQNGKFGACLMKNKDLVLDCLKSMKDSADIEVSFKCRLGVDSFDSYDFFSDFIGTTTSSGVNIVYVHARKAILKGLNPKKNRSVPPLNYKYVSKIKKDFPQINFILNGGIKNLEEAKTLSNSFDGVMIGRLIQTDPFCLSNVDNMFFDHQKNTINLNNIVSEYFLYIKKQLKNESIYKLLSPLMGVFFAKPFGKKIKSEIHNAIKDNKIDQLEKFILNSI